MFLGYFIAHPNKVLLFFAKMNNGNLYRKAIEALTWGDACTCGREAPATLGQDASAVIAIGHKNPDGDSVMSAMAYAHLMRELGYNVVAKMAGPANKETCFAAKAFGFELPGVQSAVSAADSLILTDHSDYAQAIDGVRDARILQVVDHHGIGDISESKLLYAKYMPVGACCSIVYTSYKELEVEITPAVAKILLAGILTDTLNLVKVTCTDVDRAIYGELVTVLAAADNISYEEEFDKIQRIYKGMSEAAKNFDGMTDEEIFNADAKEYDINGVHFCLGSMDWDHPESIDSFLHRMLKVMDGRGLMFCRVGFLEHSYILYCGAPRGVASDFGKNVAELAFGQSVHPGVIYCERRLSRKLDVVPMLTKALG